MTRRVGIFPHISPTQFLPVYLFESGYKTQTNSPCDIFFDDNLFRNKIQESQNI